MKTTKDQTKEEEEDEEVFEIVDHTCASDWEELISSIENIITKWHLDNTMKINSFMDSDVSTLPKNKISGSKNEMLKNGRKSYFIHHYFSSDQSENLPDVEKNVWKSCGKLNNTNFSNYISKELHNSGIDFRKDHHYLHQWFGLSQFLLISSIDSDSAISIGEARMLTSALAIATQNTKCCLATFVPVGEESKNNFIGYLTDDGVEVHYHTSHLPYVPRSYSHLSGLADFFVSKLDPNTPVNIANSACFTFNFKNWYPEDWRVFGQTNVGVTFGAYSFPLNIYLWGPKNDPLESMQLSAQWPDFTQDTVLDNAVYSEFNVNDAPIWTLARNFRSKIACNMTETLLYLTSTYLQIMDIDKNFQIHENKETNIADAVFSAVVKKAPETLTPDYIQAVVETLFGMKESEKESQLDYPTLQKMGLIETEKLSPKFGKIAPKDSLTWLIALHTSNEMADQELKNLAMIWNEIVRQIRIHWEEGRNFKKLTGEVPDLRYILLHQKLQMLDYCISKKNSLVSRKASLSTQKSLDGWEENSDEEVFFDVHDEDIVEEKATNHEGREGHLRILPNAKMKNGYDIYIPETQDQGPMTEDMVEEQQLIFEGLGTTQEAALLRQKLQTSQLKSDMEAFKAANPGAEIEDFIQWHSPNDWVSTEESPSGSLSLRMQDEQNIWRLVWQEAEPVSAKRQKQLFNHEQEALKVLHHFENMSIGDLLQQILATSFFVAYDTMISQKKMIKLKPIAQLIQSYAKDIVDFPWSTFQSSDVFVPLLRKVKQIEIMMSYALSLYHKFPGEYELIERLLEREECLLYSPEERKSVATIFVGEKGHENFQNMTPETREFVLRATSPHPFPHSRRLPHRLYALLTKNEFRVIEAFSTDISLY